MTFDELAGIPFKKGRGYDQMDVDSRIAEMCGLMSDLQDKNENLLGKIRALNEEKDAIGRALVTAEREAKRIISEAVANASDIVSNAENKALTIASEAEKYGMDVRVESEERAADIIRNTEDDMDRKRGLADKEIQKLYDRASHMKMTLTDIMDNCRTVLATVNDDALDIFKNSFVTFFSELTVNIADAMDKRIRPIIDEKLNDFTSHQTDEGKENKISS